MKKGSDLSKVAVEDDMRAEYDFARMPGAVQGKYHKAYREGHTVKVRKTDGTVELRHFGLEDGAVMLEPDVRRHFPDSTSVNLALRGLIRLAPSSPRRRLVRGARAQRQTAAH